MTDILLKISSIFILGLIGGFVPGPILISAMTESLRSFGKGSKIIIWALISETIIALLILLVLFSIGLPVTFFYLISIIGGLYLLYLAWRVSKIKMINDHGLTVFNFYKIFLLTILNGSFWIFWITICVPLAFELKEIMFAGQYLFLFFFEAGWLIATLLVVFIFSR